MRDPLTSGSFVERKRKWMVYIDAEVAGVCRKKGWGQQIRRKWAVREKPVADSPIDDYEWKLLPEGGAAASEAAPRDIEIDEGTYFVLGYDSHNRKFVLQHDTDRCGDWGDHWLTCTYTELNVPFDLWRVPGEPDQLPPKGWLERLLADLTTRFSPNHFSIT
jgi:hypothetical protein